MLRFYEVIDYCLEQILIDQMNWAMLEKFRSLRPNNLEELKKELIPKYERMSLICTKL